MELHLHLPIFTAWWSGVYSHSLQVDSAAVDKAYEFIYSVVQRLRFGLKMYSQVPATNKQTNKQNLCTYLLTHSKEQSPS
jgi:hypothetical protein